MIGIVDYFNVDILKVKVYLVKGSHKYGRIFDLVFEDSKWKIQKICNMATLHREYQAIYSMSKITFSSILLNPIAIDEGDQPHFEIPAKLNSVLQHRYNASQFAAIKSSLKKSGVTLIQGPPGTGKTNTILGILSVLLNSKQEKDMDHAEPSVKKIVDETLNLTVYSTDAKKAHFKKAMPWLSGGFRNWRDGDKSPIDLPLDKHLVYPTAVLTDK
jgi:superfamily I DNA and/or RNA helicase